jgi:hypothetical protein
VRVDYVTPGEPKDGLHVERNRNEANHFCGVETLEDIVRDRPDNILETHRELELY